MARPRPQRADALDSLTFGDRLPWSVGLLLLVTVVPSLFVAFSSRHVGPIFAAVALTPPDVLHGQVWRLATHVLVEPSAYGLFFAGLTYVWFGRDLAREWGDAWFLRVFGGLTLGASILTVLLSVVDPSVRTQSYIGTIPMTGAMLIAWGFTFPDRFVRIWFVFTVKAVWIAWGTLILTVLYAVYHGWEHELPVLLTEVAVFAYLFRDSVVRPLRRFRMHHLRRQEDLAALRRMRAARVKSAAHLRVIESIDDDPPPLSPDAEARLATLLRPKNDRPYR